MTWELIVISPVFKGVIQQKSTSQVLASRSFAPGSYNLLTLPLML